METSNNKAKFCARCNRPLYGQKICSVCGSAAYVLRPAEEEPASAPPARKYSAASSNTNSTQESTNSDWNSQPVQRDNSFSQSLDINKATSNNTSSFSSAQNQSNNMNADILYPSKAAASTENTYASKSTFSSFGSTGVKVYSLWAWLLSLDLVASGILMWLITLLVVFISKNSIVAYTISILVGTALRLFSGYMDGVNLKENGETRLPWFLAIFPFVYLPLRYKYLQDGKTLVIVYFVLLGLSIIGTIIFVALVGASIAALLGAGAGLQ